MMKKLLENWRKFNIINEVSPYWRSKGDINTDTITPFGNYGSLQNKHPKTLQDTKINDEFVRYAGAAFDRIFKTDGFYTKQLSTPEGIEAFVADPPIQKAFAGDVVHALLHEMFLQYSFHQFQVKKRDLEKYDIWMNIMETLVYYLQNGRKGTNPRPFGEWIVDRMEETIGSKLPNQIQSNKLHDLFIKLFSSGTKDRPNHNQIAQIPETVRKPFMRNIRKAVSPKSNQLVNPLEAFTKGIAFFINDVAVGGNAESFLVNQNNKNFSNEFAQFYNTLELKARQLGIINK
jgi:hypothetical protein